MSFLQNLEDEHSSGVDTEVDLTSFKVMGHNLVLRPISHEKKTKGGIILTDKTSSDMTYLTNVCEVVGMGPTAYTQDMFEKSGPWCEVGDFVVIPKLSGFKVKFKGVPLIIISCDKIVAVIEDPTDLDPAFNLTGS